MILSIESSCDDSSIAISRISDYSIVFHQKISQDIEHSKYGGVVPEIASRLHAVALPRILTHMDKRFLSEIKAIAVTNEPGLSVSLIEGVMMAKALSITLKIPLIAINHLKGHIYSLFLEKEARFPISILLLSGGHSLILEAYSHENITIIANTLDDSFGEAYDKVAKMLGLGYPGGPIVESMALQSRQCSITFPIPLRDKRLAFSFSGLKNAVRIYIEEHKARYGNLDNETIANICNIFQVTAIKHITQKMRLYLKKSTIQTLGIVGGASANKTLRGEIECLCDEFGKEILFAPMEFCSDNAAMIGRCGIESYNRNEFVKLENLDISPYSSIFKSID